ncbi:hypothetical protein LXL04_019002 [Taraxacum kok-saghyz]
MQRTRSSSRFATSMKSKFKNDAKNAVDIADDDEFVIPPRVSSSSKTRGIKPPFAISNKMATVTYILKESLPVNRNNRGEEEDRRAAPEQGTKERLPRSDLGGFRRFLHLWFVETKSSTGNLRTVQMRTIIGGGNGGTNLGHLFQFAADQFSDAGALLSAQHIFVPPFSNLIICWDLLRTHIFLRTRELPQFPISPKPLFLSKNRLRNPPKHF